MNSIISDKLNELNKLCATFNVKAMYAFGSVCTDKFYENSDIDFLITFNQMDYSDYADSYFDLQSKLSELFRRPVDLLTSNSLSNPYFIEKMEQTKQLIYAA